MWNRIHKYSLKFLSVLVLTSFLFTNFCLSQYIENCSFKKTSCCCKNSDEDISGFLDSNKKCCCEIKEVTNTKLEATLNSFDTNQKLSIHFINYSDLIIINDINSFINNVYESNHSPPRNIYILNSSLRI